MKKILFITILSFLLFTGCENTMINSPTSKVEEFLSSYQNLDNDVREELENIISKDENMTSDQKQEYQDLLEKQYQNISYKITDENTNDDTATVDVEIEVYDYQSSITKSKKYYLEHQDEFNEETSSEDESKVEETIDDIKEVTEDTIDTVKSYIDYKIQELKNVTEKTKYDITFTLTKEDGEWVIDELSDDDLLKLHGLY
jgi:outer membrane murein-binding lipoprotein Lpp